MKRCNGYAFLSGTVMAMAFVSFMVWSVIPIGGGTLPHLLEANWHWSFRFSAALVSIMSAVLGVSAILMFGAIAVRTDDSGKRTRI